MDTHLGYEPYNAQATLMPVMARNLSQYAANMVK